MLKCPIIFFITAISLILFNLQAEGPLKRSKYNFKTDILPVFEKYCISCHGPKKKKGGVRITDLNPDMVKGHDGDKWYGMLDVLNLGDMPPEDEEQPKDAERRMLTNWLTDELKYASQMKKGDTTTVIRRLNKDQYTNTLQDLLGIKINYGKELPGDGTSHDGFKNNGETLSVSALHMDYYIKIARQALDKAIVTGKAPEVYRFKVNVGKGISDTTGKRGLGYQSISLNYSDYTVQELGVEGKGFGNSPHRFKPFTDEKNYKDNVESRLRQTFFVDMRGSKKKRFRLVPEGMIMMSSLPHTEKSPEIWQGPAPNLKVVMRDFPKEGDFIVRVEASKAPIIQHLDTPVHKNIPTVAKFDTKSFKISTAGDAVIVDARKPEKQNGLNFKGNYIHTKRSPSQASYSFEIQKSGYYQIDAVYAAQDHRPISLKIDGKTYKKLLNGVTGGWEMLNIEGQIRLKLKKGKHTLSFNHRGAIPHIQAFVLSKVESGEIKVEKKTPEKERTELKFAEYDPYIRAFVGNRLDDGMEYANFDRARKVTAKYGTTQTVTFKGRLEDMPLPVVDLNDKGSLANMGILGVWNDSFVKNNKNQGSPVLIKSIEFEGPYFECWPPKSHTDIFIDSKNNNDKEAYTREILHRFMTKAFRRMPEKAEVDKLVDFWKQNHSNYSCFEDSIKELLVIVLCSPKFLYIAEPEEGRKNLSDFQLASRLSYFLWDSKPDERLMKLARADLLKDNLKAEMQRMIKDSRAYNFSKAFTHQWLDLRRLENVPIKIEMYPAYTRFIKEDMAKETFHFFHEVLTENLSIMNFIDSDFIMVNQNLAQFYGIEGVYGSEFRKVAVPRSKNRGGLLSQGSFLTGHSSGEDSHPIKRGVWLIKKMLDNPPPEPPPNVPLPDPEDPTLAKLSKKQQLEKHRDKASCRDCHRKIDPWGVAFEGYDAIGQLRTEIRTKKSRMKVDSKSVLPGRIEIDGIQGLKKYILGNERENVSRSVVKHMLAYALGRSLNFTDDHEIKKILEHVNKNDWKMHAVVEGIITSKLFIER